MANMRIINITGLSNDTRVMCGNEELNDITSICIDEIKPGGLVTATITVHKVQLNVFSCVESTNGGYKP